jgi:uncharacterized protein YkwD
MNWIDLLLLLIVLFAIWSGWNKGFIAGILDLVGWIGSILIGLYFYKYTASLLERIFSIGVYTYPLAFIFTIILARIVLAFITNRIVYSASPQTHSSAINKLLGIIPGGVNGVIYAALAAALLLSFPLSDEVSAATKQSKAAAPLAMQVEWLDEKISPIFDKAVNQSMNQITLHPKSDETVTLPFKVTTGTPRPDLEAEMLVLVNEERKKVGLGALVADNELLKVARAHSQDMFIRGYFSHFSPEGKASSDRIRNAGIRFLIAGENLALGQTLSICHSGLMNSPGHKANILEKRYGRVGIGIIDGGRRGLMITQNFKN